MAKLHDSLTDEIGTICVQRNHFVDISTVNHCFSLNAVWFELSAHTLVLNTSQKLPVRNIHVHTAETLRFRIQKNIGK